MSELVLVYWICPPLDASVHICTPMYIAELGVEWTLRSQRRDKDYVESLYTKARIQAAASKHKRVVPTAAISLALA